MISPSSPLGELFHVGLRVADVKHTMTELTASTGLTWAPPQRVAMRPWLPETGYQDFEIILTESVEGPVHTELTQGPPGSIWDAAAHGAGLHHFGVWVDDVGETVRTLMDQGWVVEMAGASPEEGFGVYAYVRSPSGVVYEPVSTISRGPHERWWAGDDLIPGARA